MFNITNVSLQTKNHLEWRPDAPPRATTSGGAWAPRSAGQPCPIATKFYHKIKHVTSNNFYNCDEIKIRSERVENYLESQLSPPGSKPSIRRLGWRFGARVVQVDSPALGLQKPSRISGQFGRKTKNPKPRVFHRRRRVSSNLSPATGYDRLRGWLGYDEGVEVVRTGPVGWPEVAGRRSSGHPKRGREGGCDGGERESRARGERKGFLNRKPPKTEIPQK